MSCLGNIHVTGATGYLASNWLNASALPGKFFIYDRTLKLDRLKLESEYSSQVYNLAKGQITVEEPATVVHAAYVNDLEAELTFLESLPASVYLVYFSSAAVYGNAGAEALKEDSPLEPISDYGRYKLKLEKFIQEKFAKHLILRIANPFGKEPGTRGAIKIFEECIKNKEPITLNQDELGANLIRDFLWVDDFAHAVDALICKESTGVFNIGSGQAQELPELIRVMDASAQINFDGYKDGDILKSVLDLTKLKSTIPGLELRSFAEVNELKVY